MFSNKFICRLIVPLIFEQLLAVSVGMVDTFMVSIVGQVAVSGVALVDNINRLIIQIMAAFATGGVVIASQYFGCDDRVRARHTCAQLETIMMIFSVVAALIFCVFTSPILSLILVLLKRMLWTVLKHIYSSLLFRIHSLVCIMPVLLFSEVWVTVKSV